jgi:hypothetical protein
MAKLASPGQIGRGSSKRAFVARALIVAHATPARTAVSSIP